MLSRFRRSKRFRRPRVEADSALAAAALNLPDHLNAGLGRCVYSGPEGQAYAVPGPGSVCFIAIGESIGTVRGETTTALAAEGGHGFICRLRSKPVTFVGLLPTSGQRLEILDRAGRRFTVDLNDDDGYWIEVPDPIGMFLVRRDGTTKEIPIRS